LLRPAIHFYRLTVNRRSG